MPPTYPKFVARDERAQVDLLLARSHAILAHNRAPNTQHSINAPQVAPYLHVLRAHGAVELTMIFLPEISGAKPLPFLAVFAVRGRPCFTYCPVPLDAADCTALFLRWPEWPMLVAGDLVVANRKIHDALLSKPEVTS